MNRPPTSQSRGTCRYYTAPRGCFAGDKCKFTHADPQQTAAAASPILTPYDRAKKCKHYANGFCKRGENCWFLHVIDSPREAESDEDELCSICFERPTTFGLLTGCSHVFCVKCIRQWRDPAGKAGDMVESGNIKKCPMCRTGSKFITPSSRFWKEGQEGKLMAISAYKESMSRVPCIHFQESKKKNPTKPMCPFGKDCFYEHLNDDGSKHISKNGIDSSIRAFGRRSTFDVLTGGMGLAFESNISPGVGLEDAVLAGNIALGMLGHFTDTARNFDGTEEAGSSAAIEVNEARRGTEERDATFEQARIQMVAGTIAALRAELGRLERSDDVARNAVNHAFNRRGRGRGRRARAQLRPMVAPGTLALQAWDLDGMDGMDRDGVGTGLGWNDMFSEVDEDLGDREEDVAERLGALAGQMLSSLQDPTNGRVDISSGNTASPGPGPIHAPDDLDEHEGGEGEETSTPPLEQLDFHAQGMMTVGDNGDEGDDDLPALQSVSNSSDSEDGHDDQVDAGLIRSMTTFECGIDGRTDGREHTNQRLRFRSPSDTLQACEVSAIVPNVSISRRLGTSAAPAASSSSRFSTILDTEEARMIINVDDESEEQVEGTLKDESDSEDDLDSEILLPRAPTPTLSEPPFVTDGRGRVIWSSPANKAVDRGSMAQRTDPPSHSVAFLSCPPSPPPAPPTGLDEQQFHDVSFVLPDDGFTDERGKVINIASNGEEVFQPDINIAHGTTPGSRTFFGRVFDALF